MRKKQEKIKNFPKFAECGKKKNYFSKNIKPMENQSLWWEKGKTKPIKILSPMVSVVCSSLYNNQVNEKLTIV